MTTHTHTPPAGSTSLPTAYALFEGTRNQVLRHERTSTRVRTLFACVVISFSWFQAGVVGYPAIPPSIQHKTSIRYSSAAPMMSIYMLTFVSVILRDTYNFWIFSAETFLLLLPPKTTLFHIHSRKRKTNRNLWSKSTLFRLQCAAQLSSWPPCVVLPTPYMKVPSVSVTVCTYPLDLAFTRD